MLKSIFLNIVERSCVASMPAAFESLAQWLGWPGRLAKDVVFCGASLSILVTWATFHVHFFRLHADVLGFCYGFLLCVCARPRCISTTSSTVYCHPDCLVRVQAESVFTSAFFSRAKPPLTILPRNCRHGDTFTWWEVVFHGPWTRVLARSTRPTPSKFVPRVWWRADQRVGRSRESISPHFWQGTRVVWLGSFPQLS